MPGDKSNSFKGQNGNTPYVPTWMTELAKECRFCGAHLNRLHFAGCEYGITTSVGVQPEHCN